MKHVSFLLVGFAWASSGAFAGVVTLDPAVATVSQGDIVQFTVTISATDMADFDAIDALLSSDQMGLNLSFDYDVTFVPSFPVSSPTAFGLFSSDLLVGGFRAGGWQAPLLIGTLSVDTTTLAPGTYAGIVGARPVRETEESLTAISQVTLGLASETLSGTADIVILDPNANAGTTDGSTDAGTTVEPDADGDGVGDSVDAFPDDPDETLDTDLDGLGNNADLDDDGDGIEDVDDPTPLGDEVATDPGDAAGSADGGGVQGDTGGGDTTSGEDTTGSDAMPVSIPTCGAGMAGVMLGTFFGLFAVRSRSRFHGSASNKSPRSRSI